MAGVNDRGQRRLSRRVLDEAFPRRDLQDKGLQDPAGCLGRVRPAGVDQALGCPVESVSAGPGHMRRLMNRRRAAGLPVQVVQPPLPSYR